MNNELNNNELEPVSGGQIVIDDVMGVEGLWVCSGCPTITNPEGMFWKFHGISLTKEEAMNKLKKYATRSLDESITGEYFLSKYIDEYNKEVDGHDY